MRSEQTRFNWRLNNTPDMLLNPLYRLAHSAKLRGIIDEWEMKLIRAQVDAKVRGIDKDFTESLDRLDMVVEISEYHLQLWELAYQTNLAAFRAERRNIAMGMEIDELKKEIENLKANIVL